MATVSPPKLGANPSVETSMSRSMRGVAEEAPGAYKDVSAVVEAADHAGIERAVARLEPVICIKG